MRRAGDDLVQHRLQRLVGWRRCQGAEALAWSRHKRSSGPFVSGTTFDEFRRAVGTRSVHPVQHQAMQVDIEIGCRALPSKFGWISVTAPLSAASALRPAWSSRKRVVPRYTTCSTGVTSLGCAASSRRRGMGSDRTHWRTGTCGSEPGHKQSSGLFVPGERPGGNAWAVVDQVRRSLRHAAGPARGAKRSFSGD